jgi:hypothetical protein
MMRTAWLFPGQGQSIAKFRATGAIWREKSAAFRSVLDFAQTIQFDIPTAFQDTFEDPILLPSNIMQPAITAYSLGILHHFQVFKLKSNLLI